MQSEAKAAPALRYSIVCDAAGSLFDSTEMLDQEGADQAMRTIEPTMRWQGPDALGASSRELGKDSLAKAVEDGEGKQPTLGRRDRKSTRKVVLESLPSGRRMYSIQKGAKDDKEVRDESFVDIDGVLDVLQDSAMPSADLEGQANSGKAG